MFSPRAMRVNRSPIERVSGLIGSETINLAGGSPDPKLIPLDVIKESYLKVIEEYGAKAFAYPGAGGLDQLVAALSKWTENLGVDDGEIVVTSGAQHAITQLCGATLSSHDSYLHENPTFIETMNSFVFYGGTNIAIPVDNQGIRTDVLEQKLKEIGYAPRILYTVPTAHNPTGVTMTEDRRRHLVELAEKHGFTIFEDDPYRPIAGRTTPLYNLAPEHVVYIGSLSKALAPGLRIGFVITRNHALAEKLRDLVQMDFSTSTVNQLVAANILGSGVIQSRLSGYRAHYASKMKILVEALSDHGLRPLYEPQDGFFCIVDVKTDTDTLLLRAIKRGVAFVPASEFYFDGSGKTTVRLSVGPVDTQLIHEGVTRLAAALS